MAHLSHDFSESMSPGEIAKKLFQEPPGEACSKCILPYSEQWDNDVTSLNFEILLTIYLEGFMNIVHVLTQNAKDKLIDEGKSIDGDTKIEFGIYKNVTVDDLQFPHPWFKSFGYSVIVEEFSSNANDKKIINTKIKPNMYCRILLAFDPTDRIKFEVKGITEKYHFILNGGYKHTNKLEEIYTLLSKDDKFYKISFKEFKIQKSHAQEVLSENNNHYM